MLPVVRSQRELSHQLGPSVHVIRIIGRFDQIFGKINLFLRIRLKVIRINATGRSKNNLQNTRFESLPKHKAIEVKVGRRSCLMRIHIASSAVISRQVKDQGDSFNCLTGNGRLPKVGLDEFNSLCLQMLLKLLQPTSGEIVDDTNVRSAFHYFIDKMGSNKRGSSGYQYSLASPIKTHEFSSLGHNG